MQKGFAPILIILGTMIIIGIIGGVYYLRQANLKQSISRSQPLINNPTLTPSSQPIITQQPQAPVAPDETTNWKTYSSADFSFKYPPDWTLYQGNGKSGTNYLVRVACFQCEESNNLNGFSVYKVAKRSFDEYLNSNPDLINSNPAPINTGRATVDGITAESLLIPPYQGIGLVNFFLMRNLQGYVLSYEAYSTPSNKIKDLPLANPNILSTFKFVQ